MGDPAELLVLSDLHLGEGRSRESGLYSVEEDFFADDAFARLIDHFLVRHQDDPGGLTVVLNGDVFDFLTVNSVPAPDSEMTGSFEVSAREEKFGLDPTPEKSAFKLDVIAAGHPEFFTALSRVVAAGHRLEILRGNHDLELFFPAVKDRLREHLVDPALGADRPAVERQVRFHEWFYLEPGRVYIEHGNQYEASNSIRYPFRPLLPAPSGGQPSLDYPLGSLFVRYFYNRVRRSNPYAPRVASFEQYVAFLLHYNMLDLIQVGREHYPFFVSALDPRATGGSSRSSSRDDAQHEDSLRALADTTDPPDLYREISGLKVHPLSSSKLGLVREMLNPLVRRLLWSAGMGLGILYVWLFFFNLFQHPEIPGGPFVRAILLLVLMVATAGAGLWGANILRRRIGSRRDATVEICRERAVRIGHAARVPLVLMGHTHVVDLHRSPGGRVTYANSGTWVAMENPWENLAPRSRRFTFLLVTDVQVRLCRWNDEGARIEKVPMFDPSTLQERSRWFRRGA
jgi:UDP-2,3-diacylglucosamine pyrophosphatase LpxH